jgi:soluble P-type ATPase
VDVADFQMVSGAGVLGSMDLPGCEGHALQAALGRPEFVADHLEKSGNGGALAAAIRKSIAQDGSASNSAGTQGSHVVTALGLRPASGDTGDGMPCKAWLFHLEDRLKTSSARVLADVSSERPVYMLTGDRSTNAVSVSRQLGSDVRFAEVHADLRPEEKLAKVRELDQRLKVEAEAGTSSQARFFRTLGVTQGGLIMVGDGVNDAPALAASTAGISLAAQADGALSATAVEGSDVLVLRQARDPDGDEDLLRVAWVLGLSRAARRLVVQNVFLALGSILGVTSLTFISNIPLWLSVVLHEGTTVLVALNSLRLFSKLRGLQRSMGRPDQQKHHR